MLSSPCEYSEKELELIRHFGFGDVASNAYPPMIYNMMAVKAFMNNDHSNYAHSLRRCIRALETGSCYRMTPEWDALIQI